MKRSVPCRLTIARIVVALLILADMVTIFYFSARSGSESDRQSSSVAEFIAHFVISGYDEMSESEREAAVAAIGHPVRKAAHATEFASLAFLFVVFFSLFSFGTRVLRAAAAFACAVAYAATDEIHQMFVPGRGPSVADVGIDALGALAGTLIATFAVLLVQRTICNHKLRAIEATKGCENK